jgi:hypothetical protein
MHRNRTDPWEALYSCRWAYYVVTALPFVAQAAAEDSRLQPALQEAGLTTQKLESAIQVRESLKRCIGPGQSSHSSRKHHNESLS